MFKPTQKQKVSNFFETLYLKLVDSPDELSNQLMEFFRQIYNLKELLQH